MIRSSLRQSALRGDLLGVQKTPIGVVADLLQIVEVAQASVYVKVTRVINGGFGSQGVVFFEVLLDLGVLILNM